jgi:membrane protease YdiL (CAAX protease family)
MAAIRPLNRRVGKLGPPSRRWRFLAAVEVAVAAAAVVADLLLPALVLLAMAAVSLAVRRRGPGSLGLHRPARGWLLTGQMGLFAIAWTALSVALIIPVANHLTGQRQDTSAFAGLEGNLGMLGMLLALSWTLAAIGEEVAFRGYLLSRLNEVLGTQRVGMLVSVLASSVLFGLLHTEQGTVGVLLSTVDGAAFAALRLRFDTVWAAVLAHGFINTIGFVAFFLVGPVHGFW